jgi:Ca-activated chloride channel family protein
VEGAGLATAFALTLLLSACGGGTVDANHPNAFRIVSGSENESLEPIVQRFCKQKRQACVMTFKGSLDIGLSLRPGSDVGADAVWPASSVWIDLYDTERRVKDSQSIYQTPVVLGVRESKARQLGWTGETVPMSAIVEAVDEGKLKYLMTSATQSNSGAMAYLAMLSAALGSPETISAKQLDNSRARETVKKLLAGVARSAGSSGWLRDLYLETAQAGQPYDAMWNYEAVLKEANDVLKQRKGELLRAVYPQEGSAFADAPFGFAHDQKPEKEAFFKELQAYLLSAPVQGEIARHGRRIPLGRAKPAAAEPAWNFDPARVITAVPAPEPDVIARALNLFQESLRRPSLTALCLDYSGSMEGEGDRQLKDGLAFLFTPTRAGEALVQWGPQDRIFVLPFSDDVENVLAGEGSFRGQAGLLARANDFSPGGGTNIYACGLRALQELGPLAATDRYLPAIVMMTDGRSDGDADAFLRAWRQEGHAIPIFSVTFGDADPDQLKELATATRGRVFDGGKDLAAAFRAARGYN